MSWIPNDVLGEVLACVPRSRRHCIVSEQWHDVTHLRCVILHNEVPELLVRRFPSLEASALTMRMDSVQIFPEQLLPLLHAVIMSKTITSANFKLWSVVLNGNVAKQFCRLGEVKGLRKLTLVLSRSSADTVRVQELFLLSKCTRLTSLNLGLQKVYLGDFGVCHFDAMASLVNVTNLKLNVRTCGLGRKSIVSISRLCGLPLLETLVLDMGGNHLTDEDVLLLCSFGRCRALRCLDFNLGRNWAITDGGALQLSALSECLSMEQYVLKLPFPISQVTVATLTIRSSTRSSLACLIYKVG
jgi:hypothetical protein